MMKTMKLLFVAVAIVVLDLLQSLTPRKNGISKALRSMQKVVGDIISQVKELPKARKNKED